MMDDREDRLDELIRDTAREYNAPPATPRAEMWEAIRAARQAAPIPSRPVVVRRPWYGPLRLGIGIAALLALGIAIGRLSVPGRQDVQSGGPTVTAQGDTSLSTPITPAPRGSAPRVTAAERPAARDRDATAAASQLATEVHLTQVESFLTEFNSRPGTTEFTGRAQDLLTDTRLLLDSKRVANPRIRVLLEDLELILAQIATLSRERGEDLDLIAEALAQRHLRTRLRSAIPVGPAIRS